MNRLREVLLIMKLERWRRECQTRGHKEPTTIELPHAGLQAVCPNCGKRLG